MNYDALSHEARELYLWMENTAEIYHGVVEPAIETLARHSRRGRYDAAKAVVAWHRAADCAAKHYAKTFGCEQDWSKMFSVLDRKQCAAYLEETERESVREKAKEAVK